MISSLETTKNDLASFIFNETINEELVDSMLATLNEILNELSEKNEGDPNIYSCPVWVVRVPDLETTAKLQRNDIALNTQMFPNQNW